MHQRSSVRGTRAVLIRRNLTASSRPSSVATVFFVLACGVGAAACSFQEKKPSPPVPSKGDAALEARWRATLAENRERMIERLHDYWVREDFVQNPDPKGGPGHFILDGRGKPCPLASIIIESGHRDLVEEAARANNGVKVADLKEGPILSWILRSGLTQEECILIQRPSRSGEGVPKEVREAELRRLAAELKRVEATIRMNSEKSLTLSVRRMLAAQRARNETGS
jgi:hypothetical protein